MASKLIEIVMVRKIMEKRTGEMDTLNDVFNTHYNLNQR